MLPDLQQEAIMNRGSVSAVRHEELFRSQL